MLLLVFTIACTPLAEKQTSVGVLVSLSGPGAQLGEQLLNGALLAADLVNAREGLKGHTIQIVPEDSQNDPKLALSGFQKLVDVQNIHFILGAGSGAMLSVLPLVDQKNIVLFADASHPKITGTSELVFRHAIVADENAKIMVDLLKDTLVQSIAILTTDDEYGAAFQQALVYQLGVLKPAATITKEIYSNKDADFKTTIGKLLSQKPETVFLVGYGTSAGIVIKQLRELGFTGTLITDFGSVLTPGILTSAGEAAKGMYYSKFRDLSPDFANTYKAKFGKEPGNIAFLMYGDIELLAAAIKEVGDDPQKVASWIRSKTEFQGSYENMRITEKGDILPPIMMDVLK